MSAVLCDLFSLHYDSENREKVNECPLRTREEAWHHESCSDSDLTGETEERAVGEMTVNTKRTFHAKGKS